MEGANTKRDLPDENDDCGAWELISETEHGLIVATDTHVSVLIALRERLAVRDRPATEAEEPAAYRSFIAQAGRYTISGTRLIHHRDYTRDPAGTGTDEVFEFHSTDDTLVVQSIQANGRRGEAFRWQKI
jgi:hypothetical protein